MGKCAQRKIVGKRRLLEEQVLYLTNTWSYWELSYHVDLWLRSWRNSFYYGMYLRRACLVSDCQSRRTCSSLLLLHLLFHLLSLFTETTTFHHSCYWRDASHAFLICFHKSCLSCSRSHVSQESWLLQHVQARKYSHLHNPGYSCIRTLVGTHPKPHLIESEAGWMGYS